MFDFILFLIFVGVMILRDFFKEYDRRRHGVYQGGSFIWYGVYH
jgi:hypothetical protein